MELETTKTSTTTKLPMLKQESGISFVLVTQTTAEGGAITITISSPVTVEDKIKKKNDVKARSMLLVALPNEHLLTFNQYKDAKSLFAATETIFGGNEARKKTHKTFLKQMYENFSAPSTESLDSILIGFRRFLPSEWNTHVVVWRNKPALDTMSIVDLYNNFKIVEQEVKRTTSSNSSSQNMTFVSSPSTNSTNEVHTANRVSTARTQSSTASTQVSTANSQNSTANLSDATVYAFLANLSNGFQLVHEDLKQIHEDDLEEMNLKWQLALLSMRANRFFQKTRKKITINGSDTAGFDKSKDYACKKTPPKVMVAIDGVGLDWSYMAEDEVPINMALMAFLDSKPDAPLVKDMVSDNKDCLVESPVVVEKKTVVPTIAMLNLLNLNNKKNQENQVNAIKASACWVWRPTKPNGTSIM
nr:hypothetical protein [Tanacetum cinerariifolium]